MKKSYNIFICLLLIPVITFAQSIGTGFGDHSIVVKSDGTVYTWGYNYYGQLGTANNTSSDVPVVVNTSGVLSGKTITQVAAGSNHTIALASDGTVYTWGFNAVGQLGNGSVTDSNFPVAVDTSGVLSGKTITQVAAGYYHSIALASDGTVYTWGRNNFGQLGNGNNTNSNVPVAVNTSGELSGKTIIKVASGGHHSIALSSDGTVYTWGYNYNGQLGNGSVTDSNFPVAVDTSGVLSGKTITQVAAGIEHTIALASDGTVYTWGRNIWGQLGTANNTDSNLPVTVNTSGVLSGKAITRVAAGGYHSVTLSSDGMVFTWGNNDYGQIGNANNTSINMPVLVNTSGVLSGKTITRVAAGYSHSMVLASDGTVFTWGNNDYGQLGNGSVTDSNVPVAVDQSGMGALPVELKTFTATSTSSATVVMNWQTTTEVNNYGFEILRSAQNDKNESWEKIGFVEGHGNSNSPKDYSFTDNTPHSGVVKYKLKQIDFDGTFSYSEEVTVNNELAKSFKLFEPYPNPFNPSTTIKYSIPSVSNISLKIYDILGNEVANLVKEKKDAGEYEFNFNASNLASGIYFYKLQAGSFSQTKKLMLLK